MTLEEYAELQKRQVEYHKRFEEQLKRVETAPRFRDLAADPATCPHDIDIAGRCHLCGEFFVLTDRGTLSVSQLEEEHKSHTVGPILECYEGDCERLHVNERLKTR